MGILLLDVIDGITDFVEENTELPAHQTVKYLRAFVQPADCPMLNVFMLNKVMVPKSTENLDAATVLAVIWYEKAVKQVKTLSNKLGEELSKSLITRTSLIEQTLMDLWISGWAVAGAYECQPISVDWTPPPNVASGLVQGYAVGVQVMTVQSRDDLSS